MNTYCAGCGRSQVLQPGDFCPQCVTSLAPTISRGTDMPPHLAAPSVANAPGGGGRAHPGQQHEQQERSDR